MGGRTSEEVCRRNGFDTVTFSTGAKMLLQDEVPNGICEKISMQSLLQYLHNSHDYFLGFRLPAIRNKLLRSVGTSDDLSRAIIHYFDE